MVKKLLFGFGCLFVLVACSGPGGLSGHDDMVVGSISVEGKSNPLVYVLGSVEHPTDKVECKTLTVSQPGDWVVVGGTTMSGTRIHDEYPRERVGGIHYITQEQAAIQLKEPGVKGTYSTTPAP